MGYAKQLLQLCMYFCSKNHFHHANCPRKLYINYCWDQIFIINPAETVLSDVRLLSSYVCRHWTIYTQSDACCGLDYGFVLCHIGYSLLGPFLKYNIRTRINCIFSFKNKTGKRGFLVSLNKISDKLLIDHRCEIWAYPKTVKSGFWTERYYLCVNIRANYLMWYDLTKPLC